MRHQEQTLERIRRARDAGFAIVEGNDPRKRAGHKYAVVARLAQTNSRAHGYSINTVHACWPNGA